MWTIFSELSQDIISMISSVLGQTTYEFVDEIIIAFMSIYNSRKRSAIMFDYAPFLNQFEPNLTKNLLPPFLNPQEPRMDAPISLNVMPIMTPHRDLDHLPFADKDFQIKDTSVS